MTQLITRRNGSAEGPDINVLHHRLTEFPKEWLKPQLPSYFYALVHDALYDLSTSLRASELTRFKRPYEQCEWYRATMLIAYFLMDNSFKGFRFELALLLDAFENTAKELAQAGTNKVYINDVDRREEFIRVVLSSINLRPKGESDNQAEDRLQAVSSLERMKVLKAAKVAEQRAHDLRVALAKQKAKEAADKMTRE